MIQKKHINNTNMLALAILVVQFLRAKALEYSDLEAMGVTCKARDSCQGMTNPEDFFQRNCECDSRCTGYGDCCIDAPSAEPDNFGYQECMPFGAVPFQGAYVVSSCRNGDEASAAACMGNDLSDPFLAAPVSTPEGATYRNAYCAECNEADLANLVAWSPLLNCPTLAPYNVSASFARSNLEHAADKDDEWGIWFENEFHRCTILFNMPETVQNVRLCRADVVSTCPPEWSRPFVRQQCEAYMAVVHTMDEAFRNPHCALCNGVSPDELYCDRDALILGRKKIKFSFAMLLDVNKEDGEFVGESHEVNCGVTGKYDPFSKKCRNLVCSLPGYTMKRGRCVKDPAN